MSDINQDDIDKLLQGLGDDAGDAGAAAPPPPPEEERGPASQDDIDALFAAAGDGVGSAAPAAETPVPPPAPPAPAGGDDMDGVASQDDIDALFSAVGGDEPEPAPAPAPAAPAPEPAAATGPDLDGVASQDDIDALFSAVGGDDDSTPEPEPEPAPAPAPEPPAEEDLDGVASQDDIDALFSAPAAEPEPEPAPEPAPESPPAPVAEPEAASPQDEADGTSTEEFDAAASELDELLSSISEAAPPPPPPRPVPEAADTQHVDTVDMEELLRQINDAAPPPPPSPVGDMADAGDTTLLDMSDTAITQAFQQAGETAAAVPPPPAQPLPPSPATAPMQPAMPAAMPSLSPGAREEFTVLRGAGEVENIANQVSSLIATMSEKAHRYMQAWMAADAEAKELRNRALNEERRRTTMENEKGSLSGQVDELRRRLGEVEGEKLATEEGRRTMETSFQAKIRELESRVTLLNSEAESLKEELTRARNQATGVDIESRRARFEVDRLKNEVESERMERLRIQRALENREKEIQAMQSQSAGQASSLFIDELHRLVRRLESELDARSSGAHDALRQLDRLEVSEDMVPVLANLRANLMQAVGADADPDDAIKALGREAAGVRGPKAVEGEKTEMISFETAISTLNFSSAMDAAGALLREARATPSLLMKKVYQCPALRRAEIVEKIPDLTRLLDGLRTVQESADRIRGKENGESEVFYVRMFDFLHNLVRLKVLNRMSGDLWRLFLDLRGRFSFITSDRQWAEYRDGTLNDKTQGA